ncbi:7312_t:CDS:2, partial [Gigaspora rosea]
MNRGVLTRNYKCILSTFTRAPHIYPVAKSFGRISALTPIRLREYASGNTKEEEIVTRIESMRATAHLG